MLDFSCVQLLDVLLYQYQGGDLNTGLGGYTMTVGDFDTVTTGAVEYNIFDHDHNFVSDFTRDVMQETGEYSRNLVKFDKYEHARIIHVFSMDNIIRVSAVIE